MEILFETERLAFRRFAVEDAQVIFDLNSDPQVIRYTGNYPCKDLEEARQVIIENIQKSYLENEYGRWAVILKSTGEVAGWCGLRYKKERGHVDLGYRFFRKNWGIGIATEAAEGCLEYGFSKYKIPYVIALAQRKNLASIRVMEKIGMHFVRNSEEDSYELVWYQKNLPTN